MNKAAYFKIGALAKQTGVAVSSLRYYSDLGLLQPVYRGNNGYRYYSHPYTSVKRRCLRVTVGQNACQQVECIKEAQILGFTLEEIKQIIDLRDRGEKPCDLVQSLLDHKIAEIELQIRQMTLFKAELEEYRAVWTYSHDSELKPQEICSLIASVSLKGASSN